MSDTNRTAQGNAKYLPKTQLRSNAASNNLTRVLREREYQRAGAAVDKQRLSQGCVPNSVGAIVSTVSVYRFVVAFEGDVPLICGTRAF